MMGNFSENQFKRFPDKITSNPQLFAHTGQKQQSDSKVAATVSELKRCVNQLV